MYINLGVHDKLEIQELYSITHCIFCESNLASKEVLTSKLLPCLHAACSSCINESLNKSVTGDFKCSRCALSFSREELFENKVLAEVVSDVDLSKMANKLCSIHNAAVTNWCQDCNDFICEECVKSHGQLKSTIAHSIISKDNHFVRLLESNPKSVFPCNIHPSNNLTIYCHDCRAMTCRDCQLEGHKDHKYDFISDQVENIKRELLGYLKKIEYSSLIMSAALEKSEEKELKFEDLKTKLVVSIRKEFDKVRKLLEQRERALMLSAISKANIKIDECERNKNIIRQSISELNRCIDFIKCVLFTSSDSVLFYTKDLMLNCIKNINCEMKIPCAFDTVKLKFEPRNMEDIGSKISSLGSVVDIVDATLLGEADKVAMLTAVYSEWSLRTKLTSEETPRTNGNVKASLKEVPIFKRPPVNDIIVLDDNAPDASCSISVENDQLRNQMPLESVRVGSVCHLPPVHSSNRPDNRQQVSTLLHKRPQIVQQRNGTGGSDVPVPPTGRPPPPPYTPPAQQNTQCPLVLRKNLFPESLPDPRATASIQPKTWHSPQYTQKPQEQQKTAGNVNRIHVLSPSEAISLRVATESLLRTMLSPEVERPREVAESLYTSPQGVVHDNWCSVCLRDGFMVYCSVCPKVFHPGCHIPAIPSPTPVEWSCLLCEDIAPLPPATYHFFKQEERKVADRLLLEMFCQVEASLPFQNASITICGKRRNILSLNEIKYNLTHGRYISILKFIADIRMLLSNIFRTREKEPQIIAHAKTLEEIFNRLLAKFIPHLNSPSSDC